MELDAEYEQKARGVVRAECRDAIPRVEGRTIGELEASVPHRAVARIRDREDDVVASVAAIWRLSPPESG